MSIEFDRESGVNPHFGICPKCGQYNGEVLLIGNRKAILQCGSCQSVIYGHRPSEPCPKCSERGRDNFTRVGYIGEHDKIPSRLCSDCIKELDEHKKLVAAGGIYFKCAKCHITGVVLGQTKLAKSVRKQMKIEAPNPCGIQFDSCEQHTVAPEGE